MDQQTVIPGPKHAQTLEGLLMKMAWVEYKRFGRELSNHHLTLSQFHALIAIQESQSGCTMSQLAELTNQVSATMTGVVDRLVERGWVKRRRNPDDRRTVLVQLTERGQTKLNAVYKAQEASVGHCLANMDSTSRHHLAYSLKQYLQTLEEADS
ncbi:MAG: MarR family transcriptional regulator [Chloroflexota bacterium]